MRTRRRRACFGQLPGPAVLSPAGGSPGEARDESISRSREQLGRSCHLEDPSLDDHACSFGERRRILEVVRDEERRQPQLRKQLASSPRTTPRVWASSAESGSSSSSTAGLRASARASATRWRSPPENRRGGRRKMRDPEALEQLVNPRAAAEGDVAAHVEVREKRVLLEDEPDRAPLRREVDAAPRVEPGVRAERDLPSLGPQEPCDRAQHARLPRSRRSDERERLPPELEL